MKLNELRGIKSQLDKASSRKDAEQKLGEQGFEMLGSGSNASVFSHPRLNYVVKIFDITDQAYLEFVKIAMQHKTNPHFPRFRGLPFRINGRTMAVRMEKLSEWSYSRRERDQVIDSVISAVAYNSADWMDRMDDHYLDFVETHWPQLPAAVALLHERWQDSGMHWDLHEHNVMLRGTVLVFTDPFIV
jgi:hypothetical protein